MLLLQGLRQRVLEQGISSAALRFASGAGQARNDGAD
jgi:hypothetical protein